MNHEEIIVSIDNVTVSYGADVAVDRVSVGIICNSTTAIFGPNGAGKSTLFRAILGWQRLDSGSIRIGDAHSHHVLPRIAYLPQRHDIDWDFPTTVTDVVSQGRFPHVGLFRSFCHEDRRMVDVAIGEMGLGDLADRRINTLSGGQQQRVFLARALAQGADIFLLDEPFSGLDHHARRDLSRRLSTWHEQGRTVLAVIHDLELIRNSFTHILMLDTQLIDFGPVGTTLTAENLKKLDRTPEPVDV